jgi:hypothetical protein
MKNIINNEVTGQQTTVPEQGSKWTRHASSAPQKSERCVELGTPGMYLLWAHSCTTTTRGGGGEQAEEKSGSKEA